MYQLNEGIMDESKGLMKNSDRDWCWFCDAQTIIVIRPNDVCSCCDALDWFEFDE